uniref:Putative methyltransferase n=2 Tax=viral metagenome TaxID=1070528 RepID=A0A6M3K4K6_9ZZZZ
MTISVGKVGMIPTSSVIVSDRVREIMGDLDALELNMKESGLISPLAVKDNQDGTFRLLAGERRFNILQRNGILEIPVRIYEGELSDLEMKIIEKSENFFRKDMEFWELDKLTLEIHTMQQAIHGVKAPGPGHEGWSTEDTGAMIGGVSKATISQAIKRAELREVCPELFDGCKTAADATNVIKKMDEALIKQVIAKNLESKTDNKTLIQLSKSFILKDFFVGVKEIPAGVFHLVEIDPPYAIDLSKQKKKDGESQYTLSDYNEIPSESYQEFLSKAFKESYRVMADHSWLICWFGMEPWFEIVFRELTNAGFGSTRLCGIWIKRSGQTMNPSIRLANSYETFFYAWKGQPALNKAGRGNLFDFSPVLPQNKTHPTERPVELIQEIYDTFAFSGSRVLIPFLGSGSGLLAANNLGMSAVGFELSKSYRDSFLVRVHNLGGK